MVVLGGNGASENGLNFIRQSRDQIEKSALMKQLRYKAVEQKTRSSP